MGPSFSLSTPIKSGLVSELPIFDSASPPADGAALMRADPAPFLRFKAVGINIVLSFFKSRSSGSALMVASVDGGGFGLAGREGGGGGSDEEEAEGFCEGADARDVW